MFCPKCGSNVADNSTICPQCGNPMAPQPGVQSYGQPSPQVPTDGKAQTSMILGILSLVCLGIFAGIPAIILGHMSRSNIRKSMGRLAGDGMAIAGLIMGYISVAWTVFVVIIFAAIFIPNLIRAHTSANESSAASTVRTLVVAETGYQTNNAKGGYAGDIATLGSDAGSLAEHCSNNRCTKNGYEFMLQADEQEPHQAYVITATPMEAGRTGNKNYCATNDGVVRYEMAGSKRTTAYTTAECAALAPIGE